MKHVELKGFGRNKVGKRDGRPFEQKRTFAGGAGRPDRPEQRHGIRHHLERIVRRHGEFDLQPPEGLALVLVEGIGFDADVEAPGIGMLVAELAGRGAEVTDHGGLHLVEVGGRFPECPRRAYLLLVGRHQFQTDAGHPVHLAPEAVADDGHVPAHPLARQNGEIVGRADAHRRQALLITPPDAPHIAYRQFFQCLHTLLLRIDNIESSSGVVRLGELVGSLSQYFGRGDAQADRDADSAPGGADDLTPQLLEIEALHSREVEEGFVDAVYFEVGDEGGPNAVHAVTHVAVELVVRGERDDAVLPDGVRQLE